MIGNTIANYQIIKLIGKGGMANVYLAQHLGLGHYVAIKILHHSIAEDNKFLIRFANEAKVLAKLQHPNIVKVIDFIQKDNLNAIVMEYVEGKNLTDYIRTTPSSINQDIEIFMQLLQAVDYAHKNGIIHRDLKPENILITRDNMVKVLDFGIAKIMGANLSLTQTGSQMGTPLYMSPEQVRDSKNIDNLTDIYSLGVILYVLISKKMPYDHKRLSKYEVLKKIVEEPLPELEDYLPFNQVIQKATRKNPPDRYLSCREFADDVYKAINELNNTNTGENPPPPEPPELPPLPEPPQNKRKNRILPLLGILLLASVGIWYYLAHQDDEWQILETRSGMQKVRRLLPYKNHNQWIAFTNNKTEDKHLYVSAVSFNDKGEVLHRFDKIEGTDRCEIKTAIPTGNGYLLGGYKMDKKGVGHAWVAEFSGDLELKWQETIADDNWWSVVYALALSNSGKGFVAAGMKMIEHTFLNDNGDFRNEKRKNLFVAEFDFHKNDFLLLRNIYHYTSGSLHISTAYDIIQAQDNDGYIVTGFIINDVNDKKNRNFLALKLDNDLNEQWVKIVGGPKNDKGFTIVKGNNDNYLIGGYTESYNTDGAGFVVNIFDDDGMLAWKKYYDAGYGKDEIQAVEKVGENYYFAGYSNLQNKRMWLLKLNDKGEVLTNKIFDSDKYESAQDLVVFKKEKLGVKSNQIILGGYRINDYTKADEYIKKIKN